MINHCAVENDVVTIELKIDISGSMLNAEEAFWMNSTKRGMLSPKRS